MTIKEFEVQIALGTFSKEDTIKLVRNRGTSKKILTMLSKDEDWIIRYWVAKNPNTPIELLKKLSKDKDNVVRCCVAENPNTPVDILKELSKDGSSNYVRHYANQAMMVKIKSTGL